MSIRRVIIGLLFGWLVWASIYECRAGPFLDLDIGTHLTDWQNTCHNCEPRYLGEESPIAIVRFGYQTNTYPIFGPVDARVHAYYEHMSSAGNPNDHGIDVIMFGVRFE
jgi:hypothetical protein